MPPALVAMLPPIWLDPADAKSTAYSRPRAAACSCNRAVIMPASTVIARSSALNSTSRFIRSSATTTSPRAATAPPLSPVRPPEGTSATPCSRASRTMACTCAVLPGRTTQHGAGGASVVRSTP